MTELDLAGLRAALRRLAVRRGGLVAGVVGPPGAGKTWAVRALRRDLNVRSAELHAATPPAGVVAALPAGARGPAWLEGARRRLQAGELPPQETADLVAALLGAAAPFALHIEDLHDAPPDAQAWWVSVAAQLARTPGAALIVTSRAALPVPFETVTVPPLGPAEVAALLTAELGLPVPDAAARWVWAQARGHPLFTQAYLRLLAAQGALWNDGRSWHWRAPPQALVPGGVEALITGVLRGAPLTEGARRAWQVGALLPPGTPAAAWQRAAGVPGGAWTGVLAELDRAGLTVRGEPAHPLYREVEAAGLDPAVRAALSDGAARALRDSDPLLASGLVRDARWPAQEARALLEAGAAAALAAGLPRAAAERLAWAADLTGGADRAALALRAARAWQDVDPARAERLAGEARLVWPDHPEATFVQAGALAQLGEEDRAAQLLAALPVPPDPPARGAWLAGQVAWLSGLHRYPALLELWAAHGDAQEWVGPATWAQVARALEFTGDARAGLALLDEALRRSPPGDRAAQDAAQAAGRELLWARCRVRYALGELPGALADASALADLAGRQGALGVRARALSGRATIRDTLGEYAAARADAQEALDLFAQLGAAREFAQQQTRLACLLLEYGEYDRAEALLQEGRAALRRADATHFLALSEMNLAYLALERALPGAAAAAVTYADAGVAAARRSGSPLVTAQTLGVAARAHAAAGDGARALALAREGLAALPDADSHDGAWATWALGFALEASGDHAGALSAFVAAQSALEARDLPLWAARLGLEADRLRGDAAAAQAKRARFAALDLRSWVHVTDRYFPPQAAPSPDRPGAEVRVLGPLRVVRGGALVTVRGGRVQELVLRLLDAQLSGEGPVSALALQAALYPQLPDAQAGAALHQLVYRTRALLGPGTLLLEGDGYALGPLVRSDAAEFLRSGDPDLWVGPLPGGAGGLLERLHGAARRDLAALCARDPARGARLGRLLLRHDPLDEPVLRVTVAALRALGRPREEAALRRELRAAHAEVQLPWPT
ncbi:hypothetical protein [Deinococcus radiotolerans]|uniref:Uncharacterized protein n=1 Tax=Deinococcus radiotolerans TaxID=1309407 RepID=A0ABQ2FHT1_9DEIO|nr:hypothetical protein [Deinococcus radiotolerans]GGK97210.1 hypothetical protein GCM10010844_14490 [Deinococcus radiotolerans]